MANCICASTNPDRAQPDTEVYHAIASDSRRPYIICSGSDIGDRRVLRTDNDERRREVPPCPDADHYRLSSCSTPGDN
jgi:hypothetical protein